MTTIEHKLTEDVSVVSLFVWFEETDSKKKKK